MPDLKYLPGGNPLARIRHRPESEKWRVYRGLIGWKVRSPRSVYHAWHRQEPPRDTCPDKDRIPTHTEALAYADRMAQHG